MAFDGTIILISHDRALIDLIATHTLSLEGGAAVMREGGYSDLLRVRAGAAADAQATAAPAPSQPAAAPKPAPKQPARGRRNAGRAAKLEAEIGALEHELRQIEADLGDRAFLADHERVAAAGTRHRELEEEIAWRMAEWERAADDSG